MALIDQVNAKLSKADHAKALKVPVFVTSAKAETTDWAPIVEAIDPKLVTTFVPTTAGHHGSSALVQPDGAAGWRCVLGRGHPVLEEAPLAREGGLLEAQAVEHLTDPLARERADVLAESRLVHRRDLRDDHDALLWQAAFAKFEQDVARLARVVEVRPIQTTSPRRTSTTGRA